MSAAARRRRASAVNSGWSASARSRRPKPIHAERGPRIGLATCAAFPACDEDEQPFIAALRQAGADVCIAVWDDPGVDWHAFDLTIVRDTWDYSFRRDAFLRWARAVPRLHNSYEVLEWNTDKRYLRALARRGVAIVPTQFLDGAGDLQALALPGADVVVKPAVSAGSRDTERYTVDEHDAARLHAQRLLALDRAVMVQPYIESVDAQGETALVYFDGVFSHAVHKAAILVQRNPAGEGLFAAETITAQTATPQERDLAEQVLESLPWPRTSLLYARVDVVTGSTGSPLLLELELAEPSLFFPYDPAAADRAVRAVLERAHHRRPRGVGAEFACQYSPSMGNASGADTPGDPGVADDHDAAEEESPPPDESTMMGMPGVEAEVLAEVARAEAQLADPSADPGDDAEGAQV